MARKSKKFDCVIAIKGTGVALAVPGSMRMSDLQRIVAALGLELHIKCRTT